MNNATNKDSPGKMRLRIEFSSALRQFGARMKEVNQGLDPKYWKIKKEHEATFMAILRALAKALPPGLKLGDTIPPLITKNQELSNLSDRSTRTIIRHRAVLREHGIITEVWHGSDHRYEVHVVPKYLGIAQLLEVSEEKERYQMILHQNDQMEAGQAMSQAAKLAIQRGDRIGDSNPIGAIMAPLLNQFIAFPIQSIQDAEDKESPPGTSDEVGNVAATVGDIPYQLEAPELEAHGAKYPPASPDRFVKNRRPESGSGASSTLLAFVSSLVQGLFTMARSVLWNELVFTEAKKDRIIALIWEYYKPFLKGGFNVIESRHNIYVEMITEAARYVNKPVHEKEKRRFIPEPEYWFNPENANGFRGVYKWAIKRRSWRKLIHGELVLDQAIHKVLENQIAPPSRKRDHNTVYLEQRKNVAALNRLDLLIIFDAKIPIGTQPVSPQTLNHYRHVTRKSKSTSANH